MARGPLDEALPRHASSHQIIAPGRSILTRSEGAGGLQLRQRALSSALGLAGALALSLCLAQLPSFRTIERAWPTIDGKKRTRTFSKRDQFAAEIQCFSNCMIRGEDPEPSGM